MRALLWIVAIAAAAVALTLAARAATGYVLVVVPGYRVELALVTAIVLVLAAFGALYALARFIAAAAALPRAARAYRAARRRERATASLIEALRCYFAGRHGRAEQAAARALELGAEPELAAVVAARAAHELRAYERRDAYLARLPAGGDEALRAIAEAEFALAAHRYEEALAALGRLPRRHTGAARLELRAQQQLRDWEAVAALVLELEKRGALEPAQAAHIRRNAWAEHLRRRALDPHALAEAWQKVPEGDRADRRVAAAAARAFIAVGAPEQARQVLERALEAEWHSELAALYCECGGEPLARIERAERWLAQHADDAALLLALGRLCAEQGLWGKARSYLEASIAVEPTHSAHLAAAELCEKLGEAEAAQRHYRRALELALAQLKAATGGRRRTPL